MVETQASEPDALSILNQLPGYFLLLQPDGPSYSIAGATDRFLHTIGDARNSWRGKSIFDFFHFTDSAKNTDQLRGLLDAAVTKKSEQYFPSGYFTVTGKETSFKKLQATTVRPLADVSGSVRYILLSFEAVTNGIEDHTSKESSNEDYNLRHTILQAPVAMCIMRGPQYVVEIANNLMMSLWGKSSNEVLGKPIFEAVPEVKGQGLEILLNQVYTTGETYRENERPVSLPRDNRTELFYINLVYQPLRDTAGNIDGVMAVAVDVTDQVLSRKIIREREEELRMAVTVANLGTFHVDVEKQTGSFSGRVKEWFGFSSTEMSMAEIFGRIHADDRQRVVAAIEQSLLSVDNSRHDLVYRIVNPEDQEQRYLRSFGRTNFDAQQKPLSIVGIIQDITTEVLAKKALEENEIELQRRVRERTADLDRQTALSNSILEASMSGVAAMDAVKNAAGEVVDFVFVRQNKQFSVLLGIESDLQGQSYLQHFPRSAENGLFESLKQTYLTGRPLRKEIYSENMRLNAWFDISVVKRGEQGIVLNFINVSAQREAAIRIEQQKNLLDNILRYSPSGITVTEVIRDEKGNVVDARTLMANNVAEQFTGIPVATMMNQKVSELDPNVLSSPLYRSALHTLETGEPFSAQYYFEPSGKWLELSVSRMDENRLINVFSDITSIKETQLQMERNLQELQRSNANLEEFAYAASHDMKEPIRKIHFFSDRLKEKLADKLSEDERRLFDRMENAAKRMGMLIDDLLVYSHVSRGAVLEEDIDLNQKVTNVLTDLELEIAEKKAIIEVDPLPVIRGHRRQIQQLFQNLIGNGLKYSKPGEAPHIHIRAQTIRGSRAPIPLTPEEAEKDYHFIEVQDAGIGFEPKEAERIFNVFTRLHGNAEFRGTGVGLSIARKVVENHGGRIWAESKPGEGSVFKILLPVIPPSGH